MHERDMVTELFEQVAHFRVPSTMGLPLRTPAERTT